jgi:assimilatory nitrate reductase catalytic subunit
MFGFAVLRQKPRALDAEYWAIARCSGGWRVELAFAENVRNWARFAAGLFGCNEDQELIAYDDPVSGQLRYAAFEAGQLAGALYLAPEPVSVSRSWLVERLAETHETARARLAVVASRPGVGCADRGATICSCYSVGANEIAEAVAKGCVTVESIGQNTCAGTNCGSCRGDIRAIIANRRLEAAE